MNRQTESDLLVVLVRELAGMLGVPEAEIKTHEDFGEIQGFDSLVHLELVSVVEKILDRKLTIAEIVECTRLDNFAELEG